eukprot:3179184-Amphidinium_carterae.1
MQNHTIVFSNFIRKEKTLESVQFCYYRACLADVVRIALTGGPCAGKSSALETVIQCAKKEGFDVYTAPDAAETETHCLLGPKNVVLIVFFSRMTSSETT